MTTFMQQVVNGLSVGSTYAVVALGFGLIFSVMRVLNIAHADLVMVGAYIVYLVLQPIVSAGQEFALITAIGLYVLLLACAMGAGCAGGLIIERLIIRPTRGRYLLIPFIATAGISIVLQNSFSGLFGVDPVPIPSVFTRVSYDLWGVRVTNMQIITFATAAAILVALAYYVRRTRWGVATRAVAERPSIAAACGISVNMVSRLTIGLASAMAGAAGVTIALLYNSASPFMGLQYGLKAFVCMLVAGNRHIEGIAVVGLALGVVEGLVTGYVSSSLRDAVAYGLLLTILFFRPRGIFGSYDV